MFDGFAHNFAIRSNEAELIDGSDYDRTELIESLRDLRRINRWLGGKRALAKHLFPMIKATGRKRIRLLDVGTGSADIPEMIVDWARAHGLRIEFVVLDLNEVAARAARHHTAGYPEIKVVCADALHLPFE